MRELKILTLLSLISLMAILLSCIFMLTTTIAVAAATDDVANIQISKNNEMITVMADDNTVIYSGTDDVDAIETALNEINGGIIFFKNGVYDIDRTISLKSNVSFIGNEGVVFNCFNGVAFHTGNIGYSPSTIYLSNNANSGDSSVTLSSTTGLNVGDYMKISDDSSIFDQGTYFNNGELAKIIAIDGTTITIDRPLYDNYTKANNAKIRQISMFENIKFENIDFVGYGIETDSAAIYLYGAKNCTISNCEFTGFGDRVINFLDCLNCVVERNVFKNNFKTGTGYGVALVNACDNITIINNSFLENGRHYIAVGGGTGTKVSDGLCRNVSVINNIFENSTDEAINTHTPTKSMFRVVDNEFFNCLKGIEFSNSDSFITNNTFVNCMIAIDTYGTGNHLIEGNYFKDNQISCAPSASSIIKGNLFDDGGYIIPILDVVIDNNRFVNYSDYIIYLQGTSNYHGVNITISNNICEDELTKPIKLIYCEDIFLINNDLKGYVEFGKCSDVRIIDNQITSPIFGVRVWNAEGAHTITSNEIKAGIRGISLENMDANPITEEIIISSNSIDAPVAVYNDGYSNIIMGTGPLASAGPDRTVNANEIVTLDGSASTDDVGIMSYTWDFDSSDGLQQDATGTVVYHSYNSAGSYAATLMVTDAEGKTDSDTVIVNVNAINTAPVMNSISAKSVEEESSLSFTVSASDADGDSLTYSASGLPNGANFNTVSGVFSWIPSVGQAGTYSITFEVTDGYSTDNEEVTITVDTEQATIPVNGISTSTLAPVHDNRLREASPDATLAGNNYIDIGHNDGVGSYRDVMWIDLSEYNTTDKVSSATLSLYWYYPSSPRNQDTVVEVYRASDWDPAHVSWNEKASGTSWNNAGGDWFDKNNVAQGSNPYASITFAANDLPDNRYYEFDVTELVQEYVSGEYDNTGFFLKAQNEHDNYIAFFSSDWSNENQRPKLTITYTQETELVNENAPVLDLIGAKSVEEESALSFTVSASDADDDSLIYSATVLPSGATLDSTTGAFSWTPSVGQAGNHSVTFTVADGDLADSETIIITVYPIDDVVSPNNAPLISAFIPADNAFFEEGDVINIDVTASDADDQELTYTLKIDGNSVSTTSSYIWNTDDSSSGTHTLEAIVSDGIDETIIQRIITIQDVTTLTPFDKNLIADWKFDENTGTIAVDSSGNNNDGTISGATWTQGIAGNAALSFDGVDDYVDAGNGASLNNPGNQITMEAWVYPTSLSESYIISKHPGDTVTSGYNLLITQNKFYFRLGDGTTRYQLVSPHGMSTNTWYHVAAVYDGTSMKIYRNGTELSGSTPFSGNIGANSYNVTIGKSVSGTSYSWNGDIDDVKIYDRALSGEEILSHYNEGASDTTPPIISPSDTTPPTISSISSSDITSSETTIIWNTNEISDSRIEYGLTTSYGSSTTLDPTLVSSHSQILSGLTASTLYHYRVISRDAAGNLVISTDQTFITSDQTFITSDPALSPVAYWKFDENTGTIAADSSGNNNDGTINGATWTQGVVGDAALSFDGVDDYVDAGNGANLNIPGNQITMEAWVYPTSLSESYIISKHPGDTVTSGYNLLITQNKFYFRLGDGTTRYQLVLPHGMSTNTWYHVAAVYDGTSMKIYRNGTELSGSTPFSGNIGANSYNVTIGKSVSGTSYSWNGDIDDVKIYDRALSGEEILSHYNAG
ncbi:disaggregatase related repeat-containing protein [Methanococcoides methylutens]|uniref:disaggregatase related repeat-containing protein n=1 Tax=Methanococcoides methylutens TaxID=2226 RepID=UPI004043E7D0